MSGPLRKVRRFAGAVRRTLRRPTHRLSAECVETELDVEGMTRTLFAVSSNLGRLPDGWIQLTATRIAATRVALSLVCTYDEEGADIMTHPLPLASDGSVTAVLQTKGGARQWHLAALSAGDVELAIGDIEAVELSETEGTARKMVAMARDRRWGPRDAVRLVRKAVGIVTRDGVPGLVDRLNGRENPSPVHYDQWLAINAPSDVDFTAMRRRLEVLGDTPKFSVVMPVYNAPTVWLERAIESVREQVWPHWELCIADDASTNAETLAVLKRYAAEDARIRVTFRPKNGHISEASNSALALATGDYIALLDHDDELAPHALYVMAEYIAKNPEAVLLYSDEDKIDEEGKRFDPYFKPDFNPELFTSQNMVSHLGVYARERVERIGGFRKGLEGSQDYDLALRTLEGTRPDQVVHVPHVLYHWRAISGSTARSVDEKNYAVVAAHRALKEHFERCKVKVVVEPAWKGAPFTRVRYALPASPPTVSIIIGTKDRVDLLRKAVESIELLTDYPSYEIVVVDNRSVEPETKEYLATLEGKPGRRVLRYDEPFNFSALNNFAAKQSSGDVYVLLNNDVEVINPGWLTELVSHAIRPDVGCVGAILYYPDDRIQHAGVVLGLHGVAGHIHRLLRRGGRGYFSRAALTQSLSAVTAACLAIRREVYWEVGGLDATLAVAFNDVDFCMRVRDRGYRNVWTPYAELYHYESASRGSDHAPEKRERFQREIKLMQTRWGKALVQDPAYNPNLSLIDEHFGLAKRSRAPKPWLAPPSAQAGNTSVAPTAAAS